MAEGILGVGGGGSAALSNEVIDKLKAAERKARVEPIETDLEEWDKELIKVGAIEAKVLEFLTAAKPFDLFNTDANAFEQMSATTTGTSALFDAVDVGSLVAGTISVNITQLAQKDVFQSDSVTAAVKDTALGTETLTIQVGAATAVDYDTTGKTYQQLADEINLSSTLTASIEQVGTDSYRLVIKSTESGTDNALTITGAASQTLGYTTDGTAVNATNHTLTAQNMQGTIDNVAYDVSSNTITTQGNLNVTAVEIGISTISIQKDTSLLVSNVENLMTKYNELVDLIDAEAFNADSEIQDTGSLKSMMSSVKDMFFANYDTVDVSTPDQNVFNAGFTLDKNGHFTLDSAMFSDALSSDFDGMKALFIGAAEDKGLGTTLKEFIDDLNSFDGLLTKFDESMLSRKETLEKDKESAIEDLDEKYTNLSAQFASYGTLIAQMEASFSGLKMMIQQSVSSS